MRNTWNAAQIIKNIGRAVAKARSNGVPVLWVQHSDDELVYDSPDWQFVPELSPVESEMLIHKQFNSSFEQTSLEEALTQLGANHIVLVGAATNWCIRATAHGALDRGYHLTLIEDAHTAEAIELENDIRIEAPNIIDELNIAMTWLSYPGRTNSTVSVEDVDFSVLGGVR
jgi:nicotinamidase-related amidase